MTTSSTDARAARGATGPHPSLIEKRSEESISEPLISTKTIHPEEVEITATTIKAETSDSISELRGEGELNQDGNVIRNILPSVEMFYLDLDLRCSV